MRLSPRRRKLVLLILSAPAALVALLWLVSHLCLFWYDSLPRGTTATPGATLPPSTRVLICAGTFELTSDETYLRAQAIRPPPPGSISLGTSFNSDGTPRTGLSADWYPSGITLRNWKTQWYPGNYRFPFAIPLALFSLPPLIVWAATRRHKPGHCRHCGYSRAGIPATTPCPECGKPA
jgi:hypothetical protein